VLLGFIVGPGMNILTFEFAVMKLGITITNLGTWNHSSMPMRA
jgi:hypothetical protein